MKKTSYQYQQDRVRKLNRYRLVLLNKGVPENVADDVVSIWTRGVRKKGELRLLLHLETFLDKGGVWCEENKARAGLGGGLGKTVKNIVA